MVRILAMRRVLAAALLCACSGGGEPRGESERRVVAVASEPAAADEPEEPGETRAEPSPPASPFGPEVRSVRLRRSITVRIEPSTDAEKYGVIAAHTRAAFTGAVAEGEGCDENWYEIEPFGWVCGDYLDPSKRSPRGVELPKLGRGELVPGTYGKVSSQGAQVYQTDEHEALIPVREIAGSVHVRRYGEITVEDETFWHIGKKEYLATDDIRVHEPSTFSGVRLADDTGLSLPIAFAVDRHRLDRRVAVRAAPGGGKIVRRVPGRSAHAVHEIARDGDGEPIAYRIGDGAWLPESHARLVEKADPPPRLEPAERWIDVDLDRQVLVAYEGELPVYATLVSSGARRHPTETGVYRIWIKFAQTRMSDEMAEEPYSVATVPWTQYYSKDLALHTSYWHDGFATRRSHGCVNLAPVDSRFLYFWSQPELPPGWSMSHGTTHRPGSIVRVRSAADPDPPLRGLAAEVDQLRAEASATAQR